MHFINIITTRFSIVIRIIVLQPTSRIRVTFRLKVSVKLKGRSLGPTWYVTTDHISASNIGSPLSILCKHNCHLSFLPLLNLSTHCKGANLQRQVSLKPTWNSCKCVQKSTCCIFLAKYAINCCRSQISYDIYVFLPPHCSDICARYQVEGLGPEIHYLRISMKIE